MRSGYGGGGVDILRALTSAGIVADVDQRLGVNHSGLHLDAIAQLERHTPIPRVQLLHTVPDNFTRATSPVTIGWTMWETTHTPDGTRGPWGNWADLINQNCNHLFVPSKHSQQTFIDNGVTVPSDVINYGIDTAEWPSTPRVKDGIFRVVQYGDLTTRKGVFEAVEAFQRAFPNETDVQLHLKTQQGRLGAGNFGIPEFRDKRIVIHNATWSRSQLRDFLASAQAFIWLSRGEGFGLPPLQAAASGLPVVMSTHTGMAEYYKPRYFYGVNSPTSSAAPLGGTWFEPDVEEAAAHLRSIYDDYATAERKAKAAAAYVARDFNFDTFAGRLAVKLQEFL